MEGIVTKFFLYGEPPQAAKSRFVHLEHLDERSRPANWIIAAHSHADLHHIIYLQNGGGRVDADGHSFPCPAPCLIIVPAGTVHGFRWDPETTGQVLTFSNSFLRSIAAEEAGLLRAFGASAWTAGVNPGIEHDFGRLGRELAWVTTGNSLAISSVLGMILVEAMRLHHHAEQEGIARPGQKALLVARFREYIELHYRTHPSVALSAKALGVSVSGLRDACAQAAGLSPNQILHDRLRLEAERLMRYSNMTMSQISQYLGFNDPAYFSKFFSRECGQTPSAFRAASRPGATPSSVDAD